MKTKLTKIMGVTLAAVLVFSLGMAFMPSNTPGAPESADAAALTWSTVNYPSNASNVLVANNLDVGPVAFSPNYATDNTVFAVVNDNTGAAVPTVYKSTSGGHTWVATTTALGAAGDVGIALAVSPNFATDSTVFVVTQTPAGGATTGRVFRSTNAGTTFGQLGVVALGVAEVITSFDVSPDYDGTGVLVVGIADIAEGVVPAVTLDCVQVWGLGAILSWTQYGPAAARDISAVKFSPNYTNDTTILTVSSAAGAAPNLRSIVGGTWDIIGATAVGATTATDFTGFPLSGVAVNGIWAADIALPSDYNGQVATSRRAYVSIVCESGAAATGSNIYRITGTTAGTAIATAAALELANLDYTGDFSSGTLIGGVWSRAAATQADVFRTTNPTDSVVNWYGVAGAVNQPTGVSTATQTDNTSVFVAMSPAYATDNTVIVGTIGDDSAFGKSTNSGVSFNEFGIIDNGAGPGALATESGLALSPNYATDKTMWFITENDNAVTYNSNVWMSVNGGLNWQRCFATNLFAAGVGGVSPSVAYGTSPVVYASSAGNNLLWYSADGGNSWSARNTPAGFTNAVVFAPDATTVYVGENAAAGRVCKSTNSGWTFPAANVVSTGATGPICSLVVKSSSVVVGGSTGQVRRSDDGGASWTLVAGAAVAGVTDVYADFDGTTVWAGDGGIGAAGPHIYRSESNGAWAPLTTPANATVNAYDLDDVNALVLADDGTLYVGDPTAAVTAAAAVIGKAPIFRSINPTSAEPVPGTTFQGVSGVTATCVGTFLSVVPTGSNELAILDTVNNCIRTYTDVMSVVGISPTLVAPADGSAVTGNIASVRFAVTFPANVTQVTIWYASNPDFANATAVAINAPGTQTFVNLSGFEGITVYWMARASLPFNSAWSDAWSLQLPLVTAVIAPVPAYPAGDTVTNIPLQPVFNWGAMKYASAYHFQLAKDAAMADAIVDENLGNTNSYAVATPLDYSTTYYWRVRAQLGTATTYSDWSAVVGFTTLAKPVVPAPAPAPAPTPVPVEKPTPAYIWAIIGIGAVLVIVVVVLIVRTRRAV